MTSILTCAKKDGNTYSEIKSAEKNFLNSTFLEEITKIYQHLTGDYNYRFVQDKSSPTFTPISDNFLEISYTHDNIPNSTASVGIGDSAKVRFESHTGNFTIDFSGNNGSTTIASFPVPWTSYSGGYYEQLNDSGGSTPYPSTNSPATAKIFDITFDSSIGNITVRIYENTSIENIVSREISFNPIDIFMNSPTNLSDALSDFIILNQNPYYNNGGTNTLSTTRSNETFQYGTDISITPIYGNAPGIISGPGFSFTYENAFNPPGGAMTTQVYVFTSNALYFIPSGSIDSLVNHMTTGNQLSPLPSNPTLLESIIRSTYNLFSNSYLTIQAGKSINNCYEKCNYNVRIIHKEEDAECE